MNKFYLYFYGGGGIGKIWLRKKWKSVKFIERKYCNEADVVKWLGFGNS